MAATAAGWTNWAGDQRCAPIETQRPATLEELRAAVSRAAHSRVRVRAAGSGHSFTEIALTDGMLVKLDRLSRVLDFDRATSLIKVEAGMTLRDLNRRLDELGHGLENLGDIDRQSVAGSISTGTHGTGLRYPSLSAQVEALELVGPEGDLMEVTGGDDLDAARVALGTLGLIHSVTLRTVPAFTIARRDSPRPLEEVLADLDRLTTANDHFEFYVFPHTTSALCRESRRTDEPPRPKPPALVYAQEVMLENWVGGAFAQLARRVPSLTPRLARLAAGGTGRARKVDRSFKVFASERRIKFTEMEYAIPREQAAEAVRKVLAVAAKPAHAVAFPIEVRFVSADEPMLSTSHHRDTAYIAVHQDTHLDWRGYFGEVEAIMDGYDGRPHWGKRHFQTAKTLAPRYPRWSEFQRLRDRLDPERRFANDYTERVLGV
jgi:FAD-linked oxidoreductase